MSYIPRMRESSAGRQGHVTVYDAVKRQYVSATPQEAILIREANKGIQAQRRAAQAPKALGTGNVTVFDASKGLHVSATPQEAKLIEQANKALSTPAIEAGAGLTGASNAAGAGVSGAGAGSASGAATTANTSAIVNNAQNGTAKTGFLSKIKNGISNLFSKAKNALSSGLSKAKAFVKTPKGKWSLAIAAIVLVGTALCAYVANRFSDKNKPTPINGPDKIFMPKFEEKPAAVEDDEDVDDTDDSEKTDKADKANETKAAAEAEKKEADKAAEANKDKREPEKVSGDEYEVVEGDCVWNIAKAHLKELNSDIDDYTPTNVDILRHTKKLMEINDLHYEADNYVVIIQPGQKIKLKKSE